MKLKWKGKLTEGNAFVYPDLPEDAKSFSDSKSSWKMLLLIIPVLAMAYVGIQIRLKYVDGIMFSKGALFFGVALAIPFLFIHELLHAICCPKGSIVNMYWSTAGISLIPTCPIKKQRYIIMALLPTLILGIIPFLLWLFIPAIDAILGSVIFAFSIGSLSMSIGDIFNVLIALKKMNHNSYLITSAMQIYIFDR